MTDPKPITEESFTAAMRAAVEERGEDWVYPDGNPDYFIGDNNECRFFLEWGEPACIIGAALAQLGYGPEHVTEPECAENVLADLGAPFPVQRAADHAQSLQDRGDTWGDALAGYTQKLEAMPR